MIINILIAIWYKSLSHKKMITQCNNGISLAYHYSLHYYLFTIEKNRNFILSYNDIITILSFYLVNKVTLYI